MQLVTPSAVAKAVSMLMAICTIILSVSFFMAVGIGKGYYSSTTKFLGSSLTFTSLSQRLARWPLLVLKLSGWKIT